MKVSVDELEQLWQLQKLIFDQRRLIAEAKKLSSGEALAELELKISSQNESLRSLQATLEKLQEEQRRIESDITLVEKRIVSDEERINSSASAKDIAGFQHEVDGLRNRKNLLEDNELGLLDEIEATEKKLEAEKTMKLNLEEELAKLKSGLANTLGEMKLENQGLNDQIAAIRTSLGADLVSAFDSRLVRGNAIGRIVRSACTACNMNLNSTAISEVSRVPSDELASCPECNAIVIR